MNTSRMTGGVGGALLAGAAISGLMLGMERRTGKPSELVTLERATRKKLGMRTPRRRKLPDPKEQAIVQTGYLLLSALAGLTFVSFVDEDTDILPAGAGFGLSFYALAHWVVGPLLGVKKPEWTQERSAIALHTVNHLLFGLATAAGAKMLNRRQKDATSRKKPSALGARGASLTRQTERPASDRFHARQADRRERARRRRGSQR